MKSLTPRPAPARTGWLLAAAVLVAGALTVTASGAFAQPGPTITVRSLDGSVGTPLLIVDGATVEGPLRDLALSPDEIYKVEVLKGDAARAQYGEAAADGVVLVTTRTAAEAQGLPPVPDREDLQVIRVRRDSTATASFTSTRAENGSVHIEVVGSGQLPSGEVISEGEPSFIVVRGMASQNDANPPLYIVDGETVEYAISDLEPSTIRSINVLKGEAARAQYGEAGANGVILIATKAAASEAAATSVLVPLQATAEGTPEFSIRSVHPNPSSGTVAVTFSLPTEAEVLLDVFDVTGRRVQGVRPVRTSAGPRQTLQVDTAGLAAGTYTYRLEARAGDQTYTGSGSFSVVR